MSASHDTHDAVTDLSLEQQALLLTGHDMWSTAEIPEVGIASFVLSDGPHGLRWQDGAQTDNLGIFASRPATSFPAEVAVGSSWDPEVAERIAAAIARECRAAGVRVSLGPGVNIKRSPLCGRNFEYYSEDPLVAGVLGAAHVRGLQREGVAASVKHFAANNQETDRMRISAEVDERTLREIYLPAFERIVTQERPATVMCSYNRINGTYTAENRWLLTEILREEWGFDGAVVSDWGAVHNRVAALAAGLDLEMPGNAGSPEKIVAAVRSGALTADLVAAAARRVAALAETKPTRAGDAESSVDLDAHHALARELAAECAVLLKNDGGLLPLGPDLGTVTVIGTFASELRYQGGGSSHINPTQVDEPLAAIRELATAREQIVHYAVGLDSETLAAAAGSDVAVIFAGLAETDESEGYDRNDIELPAEQIAMIRAVAAVAKRTVVVLSHGGVVSLEGWHDEVDAILDGFLLGQAGGGALADLLFGVTAPSGRLAETIPLRLQDNPSYLNFPGEARQVRYGEGVMVGYRYYSTVSLPVRYPFGHGLTYTEFAVSGLDVDVYGPDTATARVTVTNIGDRAGKYVVQLYIATSAGPVRRPARELRAFTKVALDPGAAQTVELALDRRAFAYYDVERGDWAVAGGEYLVQIGENAERIIAERAISLAGDAQLLELSLESTVGEWFGHPTVGPRLRESMAAGLTEEQRREAQANMHLLEMISSMPMSQFVAFPGVELKDDALHSLIELSRTTRARA